MIDRWDDLDDLLDPWEVPLLTPEQQDLENQHKRLAYLDRRAGVLPAPIKERTAR